MTNPITWFLENFGKEPEPRAPLIPGPWRIPFYIGLSIVSVAALAALVYYVVIPGVRSQQAKTPAQIAAPAK